MMSDPEPLTIPSSEAHNLKNQLGIVLGFIDLLIEDTPESDPRRADLLEIRKAARACHDIVIASSGDTPR
jgi:hypothetical protein